MWSLLMTLAVASAVTISSQPADVAACTGLTGVTFSVAATGTGLVRYQWQKDGVDIPSATASSYELPAIAPEDDGAAFGCVIDDALETVVSTNATLSIDDGIVFVDLPITLEVCPGDSATYGPVSVFGVSPFTYQWNRDGTPISGASSSTLTLSGSDTLASAAITVDVTNACASSTQTSQADGLVVIEAAAITTPPVAQTVCTGELAVYTVEATGDAPLVYTWRVNGATSSETSNSLTLGYTAAPAVVSVLVGNTCPGVTSTVFHNITNVVTVDVHPTNVEVCAGTSTSLTVEATSGLPITYQWFKDGVSLAGEDAATLTIASANVNSRGSYYVTLTTSCMSTQSNPASIVVNMPARITTEPTDVYACSGGPVTLSGLATGTEPLSLQWLHAGSPVGAGAQTYTIPIVTSSSTGYVLEATNMCGTASSSEADVFVSSPVTIVVQPTDAAHCLGTGAVFSVSAEGGGLSYRWTRDGTNVAGASASTLNFVAVESYDQSVVQCEVSNACGAVLTSEVSLNVTMLPGVEEQPVDGPPVCPGDGGSHVFMVSANGTGPFAYQWYKGTDAITDATGSTFSASGDARGGSYRCSITNGCGSASTADAFIVTGTACAPAAAIGAVEPPRSSAGLAVGLVFLFLIVVMFAVGLLGAQLTKQDDDNEYHPEYTGGNVMAEMTEEGKMVDSRPLSVAGPQLNKRTSSVVNAGDFNPDNLPATKQDKPAWAQAQGDNWGGSKEKPTDDAAAAAPTPAPAPAAVGDRPAKPPRTTSMYIPADAAVYDDFEDDPASEHSETVDE